MGLSSSGLALSSGEVVTYGLLSAAVIALWVSSRFGFFTYPALAIQ